MEETKIINDVVDLSNQLTGICKNSPTIFFSMKYTGTEGNKLIHKDFLNFAHREANNEYLAAIKILLDKAKFYDYLKSIDGYLKDLDDRISFMEEAMNKKTEDTTKKEEAVVPKVRKGTVTF